MTKEWIQCFRAVAEKQSFTAAAEELYITESALSKRIAQFEKSLGVRLFDRNKRSVRLTAAGQVLFAECDAFLQYQEELVRRIQGVAGKAAPLRIGILGALAHQYSSFFNDFQARYGDYPLQIHALTQRELLLQLQSHKIDVAIGLEEELKKIAGVQMAKLYEEETGIICPADSPLCAAESISLATLKGESFILLQEEEAPSAMRAFYQSCATAGFRPHVVVTSSNVLELLFLVEIHKGIAVLPRHMIHFVVTNNRFLPIPEFSPIHIVMAWSSLDERGKQLLEALKVHEDSNS